MAKITIELDMHDICCPITKQIFLFPVLASDGFTYEKSAIKKWFKMNNNISPMTGKKVDDTDYKKNIIIADMVTHILDKNPNLAEEQYKIEEVYKIEKKIYTFNSIIEAIRDDNLDVDTIEEIVDFTNINVDIDDNYNIMSLFWTHKSIGELVEKINIGESGMSIREDNDDSDNPCRIVNSCFFNLCSNEIIKTVIDKTPLLELADNFGYTILDRAIKNDQNIDIIEYILHKSTDFNIFIDTCDENNVFQVLCELSQNENIYNSLMIIVRKYIEHYKKNKSKVFSDGQMYIHYACQYGLLDLVDLLYNAGGADLNSKTEYDYTCIDVAYDNDKIKIVEYLLDKNVDITHKNEDDDNTFVHRASNLINDNFDLYEKIVKKYSEQLKNINVNVNINVNNIGIENSYSE